MVQIIPAVMPYSYEDLVEKCHKAATVSKWAQIDIMDGKYVPSLSWPYSEESQETFHHIISGEHSLPEIETMNYVADLMVKNPEAIAYQWAKAGISRIIIHLESLHDATSADFIKELKQETNLEVGIAIKTTTDSKFLLPFLPHVDAVQCMGIEKIGYQGQDFDNRVLNHVTYIKKEAPDMEITIDGSVNVSTIPELVAAGATRLVAGSALFEKENIVKAYKDLESLV